MFVQTFFEGPPTCKCCKNWVEKEPAEIPPEVKKKYTGAAIILYKCKDHTSNVETVDIQSPVIRKLIQPLLAELGYHYTQDVMAFNAPFKELFFCHSNIVEQFKQLEDDGEEKPHLELLVDCMKSLFSDLAPKIKSFQSKGMIDADNLWALFPKGIIVYSRSQDHDCAFEVVQLNRWRLVCRSVVFDGSTFGWVKTKFTIKEFIGTRKINELEAYPFSFHPEQNTLEDKMVKRCKKSGLSRQHFRRLRRPGDTR